MGKYYALTFKAALQYFYITILQWLCQTSEIPEQVLLRTAYLMNSIKTSYVITYLSSSQRSAIISYKTLSPSGALKVISLRYLRDTLHNTNNLVPVMLCQYHWTQDRCCYYFVISTFLHQLENVRDPAALRHNVN